jgi:hypothetical protein
MLLSVVAKSPKNRYTGRPYVLYSFFSSSHAILAANFLCTARNVEILSASLFLIATDFPAYEVMLSIWPNVLLMDGRNYSHFGDFCVLKQAVQEFLIAMGCEVTILDGDIIFLQNPIELFTNTSQGCDFVFQQEDATLDIPDLNINIGVVTIIPSSATRQILKVWRDILLHVGNVRLAVAQDQWRLRDILRSGTWVYDRSTRRFLVRLAPWFGMDRQIVVGFYSPFDVAQGGHLRGIVPRFINRQLVWKPVVIHLACIGGVYGKRSFMQAVGYDFVNEALSCVRNPRPIDWFHFSRSEYGRRFLRR